MELRDYAVILRKNWVLVLISSILGLALGAGITFLMTPKYEAHTQIFVSTRAGDGSTGDLAQGADYSRQVVNSYVTVLTTSVVLIPVIEKLQLDTTSEELAKDVKVSSPADSTLIDIRVQDPSAEQSAVIAFEIGERFKEVVRTELAPETRDGTSPVTLTSTQRALVPEDPISPVPVLNLLLGLLAGFVVGYTIAVIRKAMDNRVHSVKEIEEITNIPVIGGIYKDQSIEEDALVVSTNPQSSSSESYRTLRTNLQFLNVDSENSVFVVSSANAGEGKSTTSLNLALTLAQSGAKVVVVEGDLRRPVFAEYLGIEGGAGLTDVLIDRADLVDVLQRWGDNEFYVLPAGRRPPNPSELLGSEKMEEVTKALAGTFDYVIIDAPPMLAVADAAVISKEAAGMLLVVRIDKTTKQELDDVLQGLETTGNKVLGVIANMLPAKGTDWYRYGSGVYGVESKTPSRHSSSNRPKKLTTGHEQ
ncbi:polysaccharide biosynthesis tyrosine autokinase [Corynebacterium lubricantis]|uniref:polysaccharide biosynthesis tyrosine autokinase n=1 Tax=Corynebacterium lubricantis TaxID=541095 RepID=UPI0003720EC7|nr:polysaccharide biosynthesis tyrosine autokinase [Corynebacterium lubricantis]